MGSNRKKVAIIGVGRVGSHVASHLVICSYVDDLVLIDTDEKKAQSHSQDLNDATAFKNYPIRIIPGSYRDVDDADIVVIAASGPIFKEDRLEELDGNIDVIDNIVEQLNQTNFSGIIISITNPCDVIAQYISQKTQCHVIGTGTLLDSARFRTSLSRKLNISPKDIQAYSLGEHGDSQVLAFSAISIMGKPLSEWMAECPERFENLDFPEINTEVVRAGWDIVLGKGATEFGIGNVTSELIDAIYRDSGRILPCSTMLHGEYQQSGIYASVPCVIGRKGVQTTVLPAISDAEKEHFAQSCEILHKFSQKYSN